MADEHHDLEDDLLHPERVEAWIADSRRRVMEQVTETWHRAGRATGNLAEAAGAEPMAGEQRQAARLTLQLLLYAVLQGPDAIARPSSAAQYPRPEMPYTAAAIGNWLADLGHRLDDDRGDDPIVTAWRWLAGHDAFTPGLAGAAQIIGGLAAAD